MSKRLSYKGILTPGTQEKIRLRTLNGKKAYKIVKFQILSSSPGTSTNEYLAKITKIEDPSVVATVDFSDSKLLAVAYMKDNANINNTDSDETIIFDNEKFNQDIFVSMADANAGTTECNYYIELETMAISDIEATMMTLQNIREVTSPGSS